MLKDENAIYIIGVMFYPLIAIILVLCLLQGCGACKDPSRPHEMELFNHGMHTEPIWEYTVEIT